MAGYLQHVRKESKPHIQSLRDDMALRRNRDYFWPSGTQVYCGVQGSGKTISAVKHVWDIKKRYPKAILVSNIKLSFLKPRRFTNKDELYEIAKDFKPGLEYIEFSSRDELELVLTEINNDFFGVLYLIDEIHTYFNALESKDMPMHLFTEISQQRKQRKCIIGTSQLFMRMAKPLREQCDSLIVCSTKFGIFTKQVVYDGMSLVQDYDGSISGDVKKVGWFFHTRPLRNAFDTYQKVVSSSVQFEELTDYKRLSKAYGGKK